MSKDCKENKTLRSAQCRCYGDEDGVLAYWWYDEDRAAELDAAIAEEMCLPNVPLRVP